VIRAYLVLIGVWLVAFVISMGHHAVRRRLRLSESGVTPARRPSWLQIAFSDLLLFSLIPGLVLMFFYPFLPFSGFRAGLALGLVGILLGGAPVFAFLLTSRERSAAQVMCDGFFYVFKISVCLGLLGGIYPP